MKEIIITSFNDFHSHMRRCLKDHRWLFRGHSRLEWSLLTKFGRDEYKGVSFDRLFDSWKRRAVELISLAPSDDWDWLAIAQHHGLATKLLDWSFNPLAAAFFAVYPEEKTDCVIYAYKSTISITTHNITPNDYIGVGVFKPRGIAARITRQGAIFTFHNPPDLKLDDHLDHEEEIERLIIKKMYRREFLFELDRYGFNKMTLFPDLDGLSEYCNWSANNSTRKYWKTEP